MSITSLSIRKHKAILFLTLLLFSAFVWWSVLDVSVAFSEPSSPSPSAPSPSAPASGTAGKIKIEPIDLPNPLVDASITGLIARIFKVIAYGISPPIAVLMVIVSGFQIMTAGGDPGKIKSAKATLLWTVVGFVIILLGSFLAELVAEIIGVKPETIQSIKTLSQ